jgi:hypothetical protein
MSETLTERERLQRAFDEGGTVIRGGQIYHSMDELPAEALGTKPKAAEARGKQKAVAEKDLAVDPNKAGDEGGDDKGQE